jgi:hypothetical protein
MLWILIEAAIALGLFLFIMWWTLGPVHRREARELERLRSESARSAPPPDPP